MLIEMCGVMSDALRRTKRRYRRYSKDQQRILNGWFDSNADHPYASSAVLENLSSRTNLTKSQVRTWLQNARNRKKKTKKKKRGTCAGT